MPETPLWDILCKCWSRNPDDRPSACHVSEVVRTVYQTQDGLTLRIHKLAVTEGTTPQDIAAYFEGRGLHNYTELLLSANVISTVPVADTALANVYRIELSDHRPIAVKYVKHVTPYKRLKRAARELDCWSSQRHEYILPAFGFAVYGTDLAMVSPWMRNGCVTDYVIGNLNCNRLALCAQLAEAIAYLHENNVVHGDIKGPNVLISDRGTVKVADFGVSIADHQEIEFSSTSSGRGTERWQAPEILQAQSDSSTEADVYALGMTMIEIYTGEPPYGSTNWFHIRIPVTISQMRPSRPIRLPIDEVGNSVWELIRYCWAGNPSERPTSAWVHERLRYHNPVGSQTPDSGV